MTLPRSGLVQKITLRYVAISRALVGVARVLHNVSFRRGILGTKPDQGK